MASRNSGGFECLEIRMMTKLFKLQLFGTWVDELSVAIDILPKQPRVVADFVVVLE